MKGGRYLYYSCNSIKNKSHNRGCEEKRIRAGDSEVIVWDWILGLLLDQEALDRNLRNMAERRKSDSCHFQDRIGDILEKKEGVETRISNVAGALSRATDDFAVSSYEQQIENLSRKRQALSAEEESLRAELAAMELSEADFEVIHQAAAEICQKLENPTFDQRRALLDVLDLEVELEWKEEQRGIKCTCGLKLTQEGERVPTWTPLTRVRGKYTSTTTT